MRDDWKTSTAPNKMWVLAVLNCTHGCSLEVHLYDSPSFCKRLFTWKIMQKINKLRNINVGIN